jgi:uncharacterized membrane protein YeaQ/YmgE (transglycosylase-associated protein family)
MIMALFIGLIVGLIAKMLMPGRDPGGFIITALIGIAGAALAHFIGVSAGWYAQNEPAGIFASVVGAMLLLGGYRVVAGRNNALHS